MITNYIMNRKEIVIDNDYRISYGVDCYLDDYLIYSIYDISFNKNEILKLCDFLNSEQISYVHFPDIIEDFLAK